MNDLIANKIYNEYSNKLKKYFFNKTSDYNLSDELSHVTLIKVITNYEKYKEENGDYFESWIYSIAKNTLLDNKRDNWKEKIVQLNIDELDNQNNTKLSNDYDNDYIHDLLKKELNDTDFNIINYYYQGYTIDEISKLFDFKNNKSTINKIYYIKKKLKDLLLDINYSSSEACW